MQLFVSPQGDDQANGRAPIPSGTDGPVATLGRARDLARELRTADPGEPLEIVLRGGTHRLTETLVLNRQDAGFLGQPAVWRAADGERPVVSGALPLTNWTRLEHEPPHLHPAAQGKVWVAELPEGVAATRALYEGDRRLPRARGLGFARLPLDEETAADSAGRNARFAFPESALQSWPDVTHAEAVLLLRQPWVMNILPLASVDQQRLLAETATPGTHSLGPSRWPEDTWIENSLAVLREPGMWACDPRARRIYLWPEGDTPGDAISAAHLTELIRIEGQIHPQAGADHPARHIELRGLTFAHGDRFAWHGLTGRGLQHDWDMHDAPTAMVRLRGAAHCRLIQCTFRDSASGGTRLDLHARSNRIVGCRFARLGGTGLTLAGYGLGTKDVNGNNEVVNCHVHDIGQDYWHSPGIFVWQSGCNRIAHNHIHNTPYTGIVCSGRTHWDRKGTGQCAANIRWDEVEALLGSDYNMTAWHAADRWRSDWLRREPLMHSRGNRIEYNDIHHVMQTMGDGNGIYISGAGGGNQVRGNVVHDCSSPSFAEGIRCDDDQHDTLIEANLLYRLGGLATGITIKGVNVIRNNVIAAPLSEATGRGLISLEVGPLHGATIEKNILYALRPGHRFFAQKRLGCHGEGPEPLLRDCRTAYNLYWCESDPEAAAGHLETERARGAETTSRAADPCFVDPDSGDFRLRPDSPAWDLGIVPVDPEAAGFTEHKPLPLDQSDTE